MKWNLSATSRSAGMKEFAVPRPGLSNWTPVLNGQLAKDAEKAVRAIADDLTSLSERDWAQSNGHYLKTASLSRGTAGVAIFLSEAAAVLGSRAYLAAARTHLERALSALAEQPLPATLYEGLLGILWSAEFLREPLSLDKRRFRSVEIDGVIVNRLRRSDLSAPYDLLTGLVGFGVYALERGASTFQSLCTTLVLDRLEEMAECGGDTMTWKTPPHLVPPILRSRYPGGMYNMGLAHGIPGVIAFLGALADRGIQRGRVGALAEGAVRWLLQHRLQPDSHSIFPSHLNDMSEGTAARLAWCYGDPGVAVSLWRAGNALSNDSMRAVARDVATSASWVSFERSGVVDASFCHGSSGLGHIFARLFNATRDRQFYSASRRWFATVLAQRSRVAGIGGFLYGSVEAGKSEQVEVPGLLEGAAGVGLSLLGALSDRSPNWDRMFLTDLAPMRY